MLVCNSSVSLFLFVWVFTNIHNSCMWFVIYFSHWTQCVQCVYVFVVDGFIKTWLSLMFFIVSLLIQFVTVDQGTLPTTYTPTHTHNGTVTEIYDHKQYCSLFFLYSYFLGWHCIISILLSCCILHFSSNLFKEFMHANLWMVIYLETVTKNLIEFSCIESNSLELNQTRFNWIRGSFWLVNLKQNPFQRKVCSPSGHVFTRCTFSHS